MTYSTNDLAAIFRISPQTLTVWRRAGMPVAVAGKPGCRTPFHYDLRAVVTWYFETHREQLELTRAQARRCNELADGLALKNAATRRNLVPLDLIQSEFGALLQLVGNEALKIPDEVTPALTDKNVVERKAILDHAIFRFLDTTSSYSPRHSQGETDE